MMFQFRILMAALIVLAITPTIGSAGNVSTVVSFNAAAFELPEGLAVDPEGNFYVGLAPTGEIRKVTPSGAVSTFAVLPSPAPGFMSGLTFDPSDQYLYVGLASFNPATHGVWRIKRDGTGLARFAALNPAGFPNGLAFRGDSLYVTDSFLGAVWKIDSLGNVTNWKSDVLLQSDFSPGPIPGLPIGANGLAFHHVQPPGRADFLYVANTDRGIIVRIAVNGDGSAGAVQVFVNDPVLLKGADGITFGDGENLYAAVNRQNRLVRVNTMGHASVLTEGSPLQFPASPVIWRGHLYVTNLAALQAFGLVPGTPNPALLKTPLGN